MRTVLLSVHDCLSHLSMVPVSDVFGTVGTYNLVLYWIVPAPDSGCFILSPYLPFNLRR